MKIKHHSIIKSITLMLAVLMLFGAISACKDNTNNTDNSKKPTVTGGKVTMEVTNTQTATATNATATATITTAPATQDITITTVSPSATSKPTATPDANQKKTAKVIIIAGQSNAVGATEYKYLNDYVGKDKVREYRRGYASVKHAFFCEAGGENGVNSNSNFNMDATTTLKVEDVFKTTRLGQSWNTFMFGPEVGMAEYLSQNYPNETFYIVKVAKGGVSIPSHWKKNKYCYNQFEKAMSICMASLEGAGYTPEIISICWMQGENDASNDAETKAYLNNLEYIANLIRTDYAKYSPEGGIPFIDAGITDYWKNYKEVNAAKKQFADSSPINYYFDTLEKGLEYKKETDNMAHFDADSVIDLGKLFGEYVATANNNFK